MQGRKSWIKREVPARCHRGPDGGGDEAQLRDLLASNAQLAEMNELKSKFVADVAHELRTSLHSLTMYIHLLEKGHTDRQAQYQTLLRQSIDQLVSYVEDTLNLAQLELSQTQHLQMELTDLNALAGQVIALQQGRAEVAGLQLSFTPHADLRLIRGDCRLLQQAVTNLVVNAIKYTPRGRVDVSTYTLPHTQMVAFEVADSGLGIAADDLPHIFDRFYRGRRAESQAIQGTGLGLAIVKEVVELHRGRIYVESTLGVGSRFIVTFPAVGSAAQSSGVAAPGVVLGALPPIPC